MIYGFTDVIPLRDDIRKKEKRDDIRTVIYLLNENFKLNPKSELVTG